MAFDARLSGLLRADCYASIKAPCIYMQKNRIRLTNASWEVKWRTISLNFEFNSLAGAPTRASLFAGLVDNRRYQVGNLSTLYNMFLVLRAVYCEGAFKYILSWIS